MQENSRPFPVPASSRRGSCPPCVTQPTPAPHHAPCLPGPLTLVSVREVPSTGAVNQSISGSRAILCREPVSGEGRGRGPREGVTRPTPQGSVKLQGPGPQKEARPITTSETQLGVGKHTVQLDTYPGSHSCNPRKRSCQERNQPGPEGDLQ